MHCAATTRNATAQDASRAGNESAWLVRMIGTRAPGTIPALLAPAKKLRLFARMLPDTRSHTTSTFACPASGETMCLIAAASRSIALSSAGGPYQAEPLCVDRALQRGVVTQVHHRHGDRRQALRGRDQVLVLLVPVLGRWGLSMPAAWRNARRSGIDLDQWDLGQWDRALA
jgi:hypothetical protein